MCEITVRELRVMIRAALDEGIIPEEQRNKWENILEFLDDIARLYASTVVD